MSTLQYRFIEPLDVLFLRGNKLFGDAGSYGEALIPPWPSVAAGALRGRMMADNADLSAATLQNPDNFTLASFHLARRVDGRIETLHALPADLIISDREPGKSLTITSLKPQALHAKLQSSAPLSQLPVLAEAERSKPKTGYWLNAVGWAAYLQGKQLAEAHLVKTADLWSLDARVGVGLDTDTRRADDGKLFTVQAIAFRPNVGFLAGAYAASLPTSGLLRLGGDGRAAAIHEVPASALAAADRSGTLTTSGRFKLILTTPGLFQQGWKPPGVDSSNIWQLPGGATAKLVCAAVPRAETISGWDLARWLPKAAERAAPTGSIYWFEDFTGDTALLGKISEHGLWGLSNENDDPQRKAEGFNRCIVAPWRPASCST